jgi:Leucine-rich repeat (LRR) protein
MPIFKHTLNLLALALLLWLGPVALKGQLLSPEALKAQPVFSTREAALADPLAVYRVDLTRTKQKTFPEWVLSLPNLNELILDKNKIVSIPEEISQLSNLQRLSIAHNALDTLGRGICALTNLRYLNLSDNFVTGIAEEIQQLKQLEWLILWQNPIIFFPNEIGMLENMKELDLLHVDLNQEQQDDLRNLLPKCYIHFSPPCNCYND